MWRGAQAPPQRYKRPVQQPPTAASVAHRAVIEQRANAMLGDERQRQPHRDLRPTGEGSL